ncbi:MAG: nitrile hydratase subunit beta [Rhodobacteraceae bacterium]|nr:nitrile hydratase subunit beta [Paracoccaceae bacterium]MCP5342168.1 nitrile hydratase subunit beta [Paracoccaceae bacterium]
MDGLHDLGGKQGFGPIPVGNDEAFKHDWERRMWGLARAGILRDITIDWFRHGLERMVPADYLNFPYFQKWATNYIALMIDNGTFTEKDVANGHLAQSDATARPLTVNEVLERNRAAHISFSIDIPQSPAFAPGDRVKTRRRVAADHTRLPAYAAAATGTITAHHGSHAIPDRGAAGEHVGDHLYTVEFSAPELWGDDADPRDTVRLELWESYLVRP